MKLLCGRELFLARCAVAGFVFLIGYNHGAAAESKEARVTRVVRDVKLLPSKAATTPAALNDRVSEGTGVRTGDQSRSELTFVDLTIERLGANTLFSFKKAGRNVELDSGSILVRVPKDSGGAQVTTRAVTVGITGTTLTLSSIGAGRNKLTVLEGNARIFLNKYPKETANVHGGQMIDVPAGATKLPAVMNVDLNQIMKNDPLITKFGPLPSQDLIYAQANQPVTGQPVGHEPTGGGPGFIPPLLGNILGGSGVSVGGGGGSTVGRSRGGRQKNSDRATSRGSERTKNTGTKNNAETSGKKSTSRNTQSHPSPTPTPSSRKR